MHINPISLGGASAEAVSGLGTSPAKVGAGSFGNVIQKFVADTNAQQTQEIGRAHV